MKDLSIKVQKATTAQSIFTKHRFITLLPNEPHNQFNHMKNDNPKKLLFTFIKNL